MKTFLLLVVSLFVWPCGVTGQTKLKVAYPTTVGSMAVVRVTKVARRFETHGLEVEFYRSELFERARAGGFIKKLYGE